MNCHKHRQNQAEGICVYCGNFFCYECLVEVEGRNYCKEHVKEAIAARMPLRESSPAFVPTAPEQRNLVIHNQLSNTATTKSHSNFVINGVGFHFAFQIICLMGILSSFFIMLLGFYACDRFIMLFGSMTLFLSFVFMALDHAYCKRI